MLSSYGLVKKAEAFIEREWQRKLIVNSGLIDIIPESTVPIITSHNPLQFVPGKWGYALPDLKGEPLPFAFVEEVIKHPVWRGPIRNSRCLIPASFYYEWVNEKRYLIYNTKAHAIAFGGLLSERKDPKTGLINRSFSIVLTAANQRMSVLSQRMPVIIKPKYFNTWLTATSLMEVTRLFTPPSSDEWNGFPIANSITCIDDLKPIGGKIYVPAPVEKVDNRSTSRRKGGR